VAICVGQRHNVSESMERSHLILSLYVSLNVDISNQNIVGGASNVFPDTLNIFQEVVIRRSIMREVKWHIKVQRSSHYRYLIMLSAYAFRNTFFHLNR